MKETNLPFQLCSMLSVNLIPQCKLFISPIQATPWSKIKYNQEPNLTQKTLEEPRSQVPWTRRASEKLVRHIYWKAVSDLCIQGKNRMHQDNGLEEQAQPTAGAEFSRKRNWTVKRNQESRFWKDSPHPENLRAEHAPVHCSSCLKKPRLKLERGKKSLREKPTQLWDLFSRKWSMTLSRDF